MVGDRLGRVGLLFALLALPGSLACTRASLAPAPSSTHADPPAAKHVGRSQPPPTEPGLRILGEGGRALAGASVCVLSGPERELLRCRAADDAGIVEDEGGSLDADLRLVISVADHCGREVLAAERVVTLEPCPTHALRGRVVDSAGAALAGARLRVMASKTTVGWALSDARGEFSLALDTDDLVVSIDARADGFAPTWSATLLPSTGNEITLLPESTLAGIVVDEHGAALAGVPVRTEIGLAALLDARFVPERARSDAQGRFELRGLGPGDYRVLVDAPRLRSDTVEVALGAGARQAGLRLLAQRGKVLRVELLEPDGRPCRRGRVMIEAPWREGVAEGGGWWAFADVQCGRCQISARCEGAALVRDSVDVQADTELTLTGEAGAAISGVVIDPNGGPVAGAYVHAVGAINHEGTRTDGAGRFELDGLAAEPVRLDVTKLGVLVESRPAISLGRNEVRKGVELVANPGLCVGGVVQTDPDQTWAVKLSDHSATLDVVRVELGGQFRACGLRPHQRATLELLTGRAEPAMLESDAGPISSFPITTLASGEPWVELRPSPR